MKISDLIIHLEKIKAQEGDLMIFNDRYSSAVSPTEESAFVVAYLRNPKNKREVKRFWSEYRDKTEDKAEKVLKNY